MSIIAEMEEIETQTLDDGKVVYQAVVEVYHVGRIESGWLDSANEALITLQRELDKIHESLLVALDGLVFFDDTRIPAYQKNQDQLMYILNIDKID